MSALRICLVVIVWLAWFVLAGGVGFARSRPDDRVDDRRTRVWADTATAASVVGAIAIALTLPIASIPYDPWLTVALGSTLAVLGIALRQWAARTLGVFFTPSVTIRPGHRVVTSGPYQFVRHPGNAAMLVSMVGLGLTLGNGLSVALMAIGFFLAHLPRIWVEESVLEAGLGEEYREFELTRKRLIPGVW
jgi:protein-S-isoprenylcysteine O-methyltransferase Ste14